MFKFKNLPNSLSSILNPSDNLINIESNTEQAENNLTEELFFKKKKKKKKKDVEEKIAEYKIIRTTNFINESYFLYDKSNLIKKHL